MDRRTKIVTTLGKRRGGRGDTLYDGSGDRVSRVISHGELLTWFIEAGANIFRFNMSFAGKTKKYGENECKYLEWLKLESTALARRVSVLGDLPGPKIRVDTLYDPSLSGSNQASLEFKPGDTVVLNFGSDDPSRGEPSARVAVSGRPFSEQVDRIGEFPDIGTYIRATPQVMFVIGDGTVTLEPVRTKGDFISCKVIQEGVLIDGKGLTIKNAKLKVKTFQEEDRKALQFLLDNAGTLLAYVAVSFVQTRKDVLVVKKFIDDWLAKHPLQKPGPGVIAKVETAEAWQNIDEILDAADGVMVARGDLGEQLPPEEVPEIQKRLIRKCSIRGKPVITATQMLDSMEHNPEPTRAEATDVFNAILDGTDAVMLSGETSAGQFPVQAIRIMSKIAVKAEAFFFSPGARRSFEEILRESRELIAENSTRFKEETGIYYAQQKQPAISRAARNWHKWMARLYAGKLNRSRKQATTDRICEAACALAEDGNYPAILAPTTSGRTVFMIARFRPSVMIIGAAHDERTFRKLILGFGVFPVFVGAGQSKVDEVLRDSITAAQAEGLLLHDDHSELVETQMEIVATSGTPLFEPGTTNLVQIRQVQKTRHLGKQEATT